MGGITIWLAAGGAILLLWIFANLKRSRPDGTLVKTHSYRRMLGFIMPKRNESVVYFDSVVRAEKLMDFIERAKERTHLDVTHCLVGAGRIGLAENPKMNRFVAGRRLYQRNQTLVTFSAKRKREGREAKLAAVKIDVGVYDDFASLCQAINQQIRIERSDTRTFADRELDLLSLIPRPILDRAVRLFFWLDFHNLLPASFIRNDAMYTSMFIANLGSLKMDAGYHHLYEWGNCPVFLVAGQIEERPVVEDGKVVVGKVLPLRYSYDERVDDGLNARYGIEALKRVLEDPEQYFGKVEDLSASPEEERAAE